MCLRNTTEALSTHRASFRAERGIGGLQGRGEPLRHKYTKLHEVFFKSARIKYMDECE